MNERDGKIAQLRQMVADEALDPAVRHAAAAKLADLLPIVEDQLRTIVGLMSEELLSELAALCPDEGE